MAWELNDKISAQIREEGSELLTEMEAALLELEDAPKDMNLVNRVFRAMHTVKGAANMFGLDAVADLTHQVETVYDLVRNGNLPVSRGLLDVSFQARDLIWSLVMGTEEVDPKAADAVKARLRALASGEEKSEGLAKAAPPAQADEPGPEAAAPAAEEPRAQAPAQEQTRADKAAAEQPPLPAQAAPEEEQGTFAYSVRFRPQGKGVLVHANPLAILEDIIDLGEGVVVPHTEDVPPLESLDSESCTLWWELLVHTDAGENAIRDAFIFVEDMCELAIERENDPGEWLHRREALLTTPAAEPAAAQTPQSQAPAAPSSPPEKQQAAPPAPKQAPAAPRAAAAARKPAAKAGASAPTAGGGAPAKPADKPAGSPARPKPTVASSIRVDAYKLDDMVALVGELVIAQARLTQLAGSIHDPLLQSVAEEIELLSGSLRDRTLSMRMLPIGTTFDRFRRLVRDLSHELGKEIDLVTQGAETELDKTVIEQLGDPLVHLLRNSIDHGLEKPEEREAAGKPRKGTVVLSAEHSGGHVLIRIFDDGRGLDREKIARKGVERGLVNDAENLSDKEVFNMIFLPGFSTADQVSNVSGRGVGMDVVKRSIDGLRGSVDIESSKGVGTTVTVKLPLTLAIIEGLQVRVGGEFFVIPLSAVHECVELPPEERSDTGNGKRIINLRNEIVPYIRLREWFAVEGEQPEIEQIIIAGDDNQVTGIVVDEVIGQQQTVIKSLGKMFKDVDEFSGATIKGDGTMALILDIPHLVRKVMQMQTSAAETAV